MLSHMRTMSTVFHSRGVVLTWINGSACPAGVTSPSRAVNVMGARQQAQYDSSCSSRPWNGGMREIAIDSIAHPAQQWKRPSRRTSTWVGKLEKGWHLRIAGWLVV